MVNILIAATILLILGAAGRYIYKQKKKGVHCIGCSVQGKCSMNCEQCGTHKEE